MNIFGLIGYPLSHSFSQKYFTERFLQEGLTGCVYQNFPISSISEITSLTTDNRLKGLNVTIPYKELVIPYLTEKDEVVKSTGACNCIEIQHGKLLGYNTDVTGFELTLIKKLKPYHNKALVLGTGGAAKAVGYVMDKLGIKYLNVSRNSRSALSYEDLTDDIIQSYLLIVNTTPVGMFPEINRAPPFDYARLTSQHFLYDLIYNPEKTLFLQKGEQQGADIQNGYEMLIIQAEESWKIWNNGKEKADYCL